MTARNATTLCDVNSSSSAAFNAWSLPTAANIGANQRLQATQCRAAASVVEFRLSAARHWSPEPNVVHSKMAIHIFLFSLLLLFGTNSAAEIYQWTNERGKVHFSDKRPRHLESKEVKIRVNTYESVSYDLSIFNTGQKVVMYSTSWCAYCKKAKKYFNRKGIQFTEYDIENNEEAKKQYQEMGATGVPVILVGTKRMNGFSEKGFEKIHN